MTEELNTPEYDYSKILTDIQEMSAKIISNLNIDLKNKKELISIQLDILNENHKYKIQYDVDSAKFKLFSPLTEDKLTYVMFDSIESTIKFRERLETGI